MMTLEARRTNDTYNALWNIVDARGDDEVIVGQIVIATNEPALALAEWLAAQELEASYGD
jgi:hypothetical protein